LKNEWNKQKKEGKRTFQRQKQKSVGGIVVHIAAFQRQKQHML
jgi:hypothetical protein